MPSIIKHFIITVSQVLIDTLAAHTDSTIFILNTRQTEQEDVLRPVRKGKKFSIIKDKQKDLSRRLLASVCLKSKWKP